MQARILVQIDPPVEVGDRAQHLLPCSRVASLSWMWRLGWGCEDGRENERKDECLLGRRGVRWRGPRQTPTVEVQQVAGGGRFREAHVKRVCEEVMGWQERVLQDHWVA